MGRRLTAVCLGAALSLAPAPCPVQSMVSGPVSDAWAYAIRLWAGVAPADAAVRAESPTAQASYAVLAPGSLYAASLGHGVEVRLRLLENQFFVLTQTRPKGDNGPPLCLTGRWAQTSGGALLQLSNNHGLALCFNVGGGGSLYGTSVGRPGLPPQSLTLRKKPHTPAPFIIMGNLEFRNGQAVLTDSASGVAFAPVTGKDLDALNKSAPVFVEAEVSPLKRGLRVERLRSATERGPSAAAPAEERFVDVAGKGVWLAPPLPGVPATACFFHPAGQGRGTVEITGPGVRLTAAYQELPGQKLLFRVAEAEARNARDGGAGALLDFLGGEAAWTRAGGALLLRAAGRSLQLERAGGRR